MSDNYQAVYDAVRSRIHSCDVSTVVSDAVRGGFDASHAIAMIQQDFGIAAGEMQRPSVIYRPELKWAGTCWMACYGPHFSAEGDSPANAMEAFDKAWRAKVGS